MWASGDKNCLPGNASSVLKIMANSPPTRRKIRIVNRYISPILLWSRVKSQDLIPFSSRYVLLLSISRSFASILHLLI